MSDPIEHLKEFYIHPREGDYLFDEFHSLCACDAKAGVYLLESWVKGGKCRRVIVPSGHLQTMYERIDVDHGYVFEVEFPPMDGIGFAKITAKYDSDKEAINIKRMDAPINSSIGEVYVTLAELKNILLAYRMVEPK